ncbi:MAG: hypothetical protein ABFC96_03705 [Thermoguttaceae bacterium]
MKKLLTAATLVLLFGISSGCHIRECWHYQFHPEQYRPQQPQCMVVDPCCDPCGETVITSGCGPVTTVAPASPGCNCGGGGGGVRTVMPGPVGR